MHAETTTTPVKDFELWSYENFDTVLNTVQKGINISSIMIVIKVLAASFILLNLLSLWFGSKNDKTISFTWVDVIRSFSFILVIVFYRPLFHMLESLVSSYCEFLITSTENLYNTTTIKGYYDNAVPDKISSGGTGVIEGICIGILDFIGWVVNATAYPMFMLKRAFILIILNCLMPFILALAAIDKFRDLVMNWIRLYIAVFITGALFVMVNIFIDVAYSHFFTLLKENNGDWAIENNFVKIGLVVVFIFSKAALFGEAVSTSYKLFKV